MINGILVLKLYGWEAPFIEKITNFRKEEMRILKSASKIRALNEAIFFSSSGNSTLTIAIIAAFGFVTFWALGGTLTPSAVFTTTSYIQIVRLTMTNLFSKGYQLQSEVMISLKRIERFLLLPEIKSTLLVGSKTQFNDLLSMTLDPNVMVYLKNAWFTWSPPLIQNKASGTTYRKDCALKNMTLKLSKNQLIGVCGPVGGGKSSLIQAILVFTFLLRVNYIALQALLGSAVPRSLTFRNCHGSYQVQSKPTYCSEIHTKPSGLMK
jgi:ATP-binding cassette, subfamily C (CFTR/MRP), member 4